jgi:hypothetical protein
MSKLLVFFVAWVGFSVLGEITLVRTERTGVYLFLYPLLWIIGSVIWVGLCIGDLLHLTYDATTGSSMAPDQAPFPPAD